MYDLLVSTRIAHALRPFILLLGIGKDEVKTVRIPKNCEQNFFSVLKS